ncbi:glycosyltransferase family 9 protein [Cupriavidus lacunae]|uniref:Glycosyl transferase n=1 Tax=Cupriavidus lacunae TaxID=2666307 RepID=A0A370NUQ0_9BURK|nr:glycosyltransferase family 9 protein [Cupriavidus lacunae]RDK09325.1 glycosyl transferase [Cupriavidus lacunae]
MAIRSKHILVSRTDNIGDIVLTLPMVARLRQMNPGARISFLCRAYAAPLVRFCTDIDQVIELEDIADAPAEYLKHSDIDTLLLAQPDRKLAYAAFRAGIRHRIGNARQKLYLLFYCNRRVRFSKRVTEDHEAQINFEFLRAFGPRSIPTREEIPGMYHFDIPVNSEISQQLQPYGFNLVLHTKSNGHGREWPIEHYTALAQLLRSQPDVHLWLTGSAREGEWLKAHGHALLQLPNVTSVCGAQTLGQLTQLIKQADGLIASGTGPLHLSAAIGQRTLGLFPPTRPMHPGRWAALGLRAQNLSMQKSCSACEKIVADTCDCMRQLTPQAVHGIVNDWILEKKEMGVKARAAN